MARVSNEIGGLTETGFEGVESFWRLLEEGREEGKEEGEGDGGCAVEGEEKAARCMNCG